MTTSRIINAKRFLHEQEQHKKKPKFISKDELFELYKEKYIKKFSSKDIQPEFELGQYVRVRKDAKSISGTFFDDWREKWKSGLIAGFDEPRKKKVGKAGYIIDISHIPLEVKEFKINDYMYHVKFKDGKEIVMQGDWLEKA